MAATSPNLKINVGADTSAFDKGIKKVKGELRDFEKVSSDALGAVGAALGVNVRQVEQVSSALRGMGRQLSEASAEGTSAMGKLLSGVSSLKLGIAALGISGVVAAFKALNAEAELFKATVAGANIELQTQAYIETYRQVFNDFNAGAAQNVAEWEAQWKRGFARFKADFRQNVVKALTGEASVGEALMGPVIGSIVGGNSRQQATADEAARRAAEIAGQIYELERKRSDQTREIAELDAQIAEANLIARDATYSIAERSNAVAQAQELIRQKYAMQLPIEQQIAALMDEQNRLASSTPAQIDAANKQSVIALNLERSRDNELRALLRLQNTITGEIGKQNAALQEQAAIRRQMADSRAGLAALDLGISGPAMSAGAVTGIGGLAGRGIDTTALQGEINAALDGKLYAQVGIQIDKASVYDLSRQVEGIVATMADGLGDAIGGLIGDLVTGGDAWTNFANAALSAFGDMAVAVGRIAIEAGVASLGIKAALETLGPAGAAVAIGAGTALVALGAAVKSGLANVASGNYSAGAGVASGGYGGTSGGYDTRSITVQVEGRLEGDGSKLIAVINNAERRKSYTT